MTRNKNIWRNLVSLRYCFQPNYNPFTLWKRVGANYKHIQIQYIYFFIVWTTWSEFPSRPNVNAWPNEIIKVDGYTRIDIARSPCCSKITHTKYGKSLAWPAAPIVCYSRVFCSATRVLCTCERHKHARTQTKTGLPWKRLKRFVWTLAAAVASQLATASERVKCLDSCIQQKQLNSSNRALGYCWLITTKVFVTLNKIWTKNSLISFPVSVLSSSF